MKNIKNLLKQQGKAMMPSAEIKNKIKADCGMDTEFDVVVGKQSSATVAKRKAGVSVGVIASALVVAVTSVIVYFSVSNKNTMPIDGISNFGTISSATDFYSYGAVSVGSMLDNSGIDSTMSAFSAKTSLFEGETTGASVTDEQKQMVSKYAVFATGMLGGGKITSNVTTTDREEYEFKLSIGYTDEFGSQTERVLYYNKILNESDKEDNEEEYSIIGELVTGDIAYPVEGKYETETDGDETESEIEFIAYTSLDRRSYIRIGYEHESEVEGTESELVVRVCENGKETETAKIKSETGEDNSFEVEVERPTEQEDVKEKVQIKFNPYEDNGKKGMQVDAWFGENKHELVMENRPWEQGGGFDFIPRGNGNGMPMPDYEEDGGMSVPDDEDDIKDNEEKEDIKDKEDKDEYLPELPEPHRNDEGLPLL
ncbi:MAG: hypothetical protein ACI4MS_07400 [Candidatus Coproplasma sp.]